MPTNEADLATEPSTLTSTTPSRPPESGARLIVPLQREEEDAEDDDRVDLRVEVHLDSDSCFFAGLSGDVDDGGLFVATWRELEVGAELRLEIVLPDGAARARGVVLFRREPSDESPPGVGIALEIRGEDDKGRVRAFCADREPLYYEL
jgi:uncharacterized protein (TIGR02266 family)